MKNLNVLITGMLIFALGCTQKTSQEEVITTTIAVGTPYYATPETLNGKVKEIKEMIFMTVEEDGAFVKGERMTEEARDSLSWTQSYKAKFDEAGNLLKCTFVNEHDEVTAVNTQDIVDGLAVKMNSTLADTLRWVINITHDLDGQTVNFERFRMPADTLFGNILVAYDSSGRYTSGKFINPSGELTFKWEYFTSEDGSSYGLKRYNKDGEKVGARIEYLNDHGFADKDVLINREGEETVLEMEYTYDEMGNWTSRLINAPEVVVIEEREITYFED